jgi:hypothetical protein
VDGLADGGERLAWPTGGYAMLESGVGDGDQFFAGVILRS